MLKILSIEAKSWRPKKLAGWRVGIAFFSIASLLVLIVNIGITIFSVRQCGGTISTAFKPVFVGSCDTSKKLNTWIHFTINILSSILLTGSNFCMQVLTAPTREQINDAHAKRKWLDIGLPSVRNIKAMENGRKALWALLLLSSTPLHLIYNSIFSQSSTRQAYEAALVTEDFLNGAPFFAGYTDSYRDTSDRRIFAEIQKNSSSYQRLDTMSCIKAYSKKAIMDRKTVLVITSSPRPNHPSTSSASRLPDYLFDGTPNSMYAIQDFVGNEMVSSRGSWMCPRTNNSISTRECDLTNIVNGKEEWSPFFPGVEVDYCLSEYLGERCALDFSFGIMIIVCICNLIKFICMAVLWSSRTKSPLLNIGDAISSFLSIPDDTTTDMCLAGKHEIDLFWNDSGYVPTVTATKWRPQSSRWFKACNQWRWITFTVLSMTSILLTAVLLGRSLMISRWNNLDTGLPQQHWWQSGLGVANIDAQPIYFITFGRSLYQPHRLVANILFANLPQLVLSFLFLAINGILTAMVMAEEWSDFAHERKTLRVTAPVGAQRSTYYLQLPYRYALPLLGTSMLLHWLTSQAIFLDRRVVEQSWWYDKYQSDQAVNVSAVGYSPLAVMLCLIIGSFMALALVALGFRKYKPGIPLAGSCSAAISAACHTLDEKNDSTILPLLWGVVEEGEENRFGHCAFSSHDVSKPRAGLQYAGIDREWCRFHAA